MMVRDLRRVPPRRWNEAVDGVLWLPRMLDKIRAARAGMLGTYLAGQSTFDDWFLAAAGVDFATVARLAATAADDRAVLDGIEAAAPGARERLRAYSATFPRKHALLLSVLDLDEGHTGGAAARMFHRAFDVICVPLVAVLRALRPVKL